jgi:hypothetical protein
MPSLQALYGPLLLVEFQVLIIFSIMSRLIHPSDETSAKRM